MTKSISRGSGIKGTLRILWSKFEHLVAELSFDFGLFERSIFFYAHIFEVYTNSMDLLSKLPDLTGSW